MKALTRSISPLRHAGKFGDLNAPGDADLHGRILGAKFGQIVGKPWPEQKLYGGGFALVLRAFEDRHVICLTAGPHDARDGGNEQTAAYSAMVRRVLGAEITPSKICNALHAIPRQALEIISDRVKAVIFRHRFGRSCRHVDGNADVLMLEPVSRQRIVAICPLPRRPIVLMLQPWRRLQLHGNERELIVCQNTLPFRRLPKRYQSIGQ